MLILTSRVLPTPPFISGQGQGANSPPCTSPANSALPQQHQQLLFAESSKRSPSPAQLTSALKSVSVGVVGGRKEKRADSFDQPKSAMSFSPSGQSTPNLAVTSSNFSALGNATSWSAKATAHLVAELQILEKLMARFSSGFQPSKLKPLNKSTSSGKSTSTKSADRVKKRTSGGDGHSGNDGDDDDDSSSSSSSSSSDDDDDDEDELARAALAEAMQAVRSTIVVAQNLETHPEAVVEAISMRAKNCSLPIEVSRAVKATPHLILLHLVYSRLPIHLPHFAPSAQDAEDRIVSVPSPPGAFGYKWADYERAIGGFAGGESWAVALVNEWKEDIQETEQDLNLREKMLEQAILEASKDAQAAADFEDVDNTPTVTRPMTTRMQTHPEKEDEMEVYLSAKQTSKSNSDAESLHDIDLHLSESAVAASCDSIDSLPDTMSNSAPTLKKMTNEDAVHSMMNSSDVEASSLQHSLNNKSSKAAKKSPWASLALKRNKSSQSSVASPMASSNEGSPSASPEVSPPTSPPSKARVTLGSDSMTSLPGSVESLTSQGAEASFARDLSPPISSGSAAANATRPKRFWRPGSSQNVSLGAFHLPTGMGRGPMRSVSPRKGNSSASSPNFGPSHQEEENHGPMTEEERQREEMRIERAALKFLKAAVDGVAMARTHGHAHAQH